ncbi:MAG: ATP-binding protein [Gemmatimonadota bacterium]|jgi:PAS domain S-box-containing protein
MDREVDEGSHPAESETRYRTLVEFAPDSIVVHRDFRILYINPAGAALLGAATPDELIGRHLLDFTHPDYHRVVRQRLSQLGEPGTRVPLVRQRLRRLDGTDVDIEVASAAFVYRSEHAVLTIARDITEHRLLEEELRQSQKMEAVGQLTSGIAHDFKNILSIILTTSEYLAQTVAPGDADARAGVDDVRTAARRGAEMIRQLMAFSRRAELRTVPLQLPEVVRDAHALLRRIVPENIEVLLETDDGVRLVLADAAAVGQIVLNLATNSRDAMPHGGRLRLSVHPARFDAPQPVAAGSLAPGDYVCLAVSDTGTGMDPQTLVRIFDPFFTTKPLGKGTGLGMAMVHGLVTQLGGAIAMTSEPGRGTTTSIYFPALAAGAEPVMTTGEVLLARAREGLRGGTEQILIVEDEDALRRASKRVLERLGYTAHLATDGEEGLRILRERAGEIALVISDTVMPKMDGFALYHAVRKEAPRVRFMFASGYQVEDLADKGDIPLDVPYIAKPWTFAEYAHKVRQVLDSPVGARHSYFRAPGVDPGEASTT